MTPQDIATDVSTGLKPGSINFSTLPTYSFSGGAYVVDDQNSWD